uniref:Ground-like domain-containing protein n=1 Tax=Rhabditophanes sp. KR3021 TaxID=114890 RepID=A0AC35TNW7_9BILA
MVRFVLKVFVCLYFVQSGFGQQFRVAPANNSPSRSQSGNKHNVREELFSDYGEISPPQPVFPNQQYHPANKIQQPPQNNNFDNSYSHKAVKEGVSHRTIMPISNPPPLVQMQQPQMMQSNIPDIVNQNSMGGQLSGTGKMQTPTFESAGPGQGTRYAFGPREPLPLSGCFYNPTGYVCCNSELNDLMIDTYTTLTRNKKFHICNINKIAGTLQSAAEKRFNKKFEAIVGLEDFAQKATFGDDLICKIELGGKFMITYATVFNEAAGATGQPPQQQQQQQLPPNQGGYDPNLSRRAYTMGSKINKEESLFAPPKPQPIRLTQGTSMSIAPKKTPILPPPPPNNFYPPPNQEKTRQRTRENGN